MVDQAIQSLSYFEGKTPEQIGMLPAVVQEFFEKRPEEALTGFATFAHVQTRGNASGINIMPDLYLEAASQSHALAKIAVDALVHDIHLPHAIDIYEALVSRWPDLNGTEAGRVQQGIVEAWKGLAGFIGLQAQRQREENIPANLLTMKEEAITIKILKHYPLLAHAVIGLCAQEGIEDSRLLNVAKHYEFPQRDESNTMTDGTASVLQRLAGIVEKRNSVAEIAGQGGAKSHTARAAANATKPSSLTP